MDIELYREFMTLATHKSFVAAAQALNMSQPSLSRHMATLSREVARSCSMRRARSALRSKARSY